MTSQEVAEYMNRYLDGDLDEQERLLLMEHLRSSPDNQELFDRLQLLSGELQELPRVSPPFSLVDSILPQLAEMDETLEASREEVINSGVRRNDIEGKLDFRRRAGWSSRQIAAWSGAALAAAAAVICVLGIPWSSGGQPQVAELSQVPPTVQSKAAPAGSDGMEERLGKQSAEEDQFESLAPDASAVRTPGLVNGEPRVAGKQPAASPIAQEQQEPQGPPAGSMLKKNSAAPEIGSVSPDGSYTFAIKQGVVQVFSGGELLFKKEFKGTVTESKWSTDSRYLTLKVEESGGSVKTYRMDVFNGELEPEAS